MANEIKTVGKLRTLVHDKYVQERFQEVLGKKAPAFTASLLSIVNNSDLLSKAEPKSILNAAMIAASLDLPINQNLGYAYIIPYNNTRTGEVTAQFQLGYKAFIQLAQRSGQFKTINVSDVRQGEIREQNRLTGEIIFDWKTEDREKLPVVGYVGYMRLINGFEKTLYMTIEELRSHGSRYSQSMKRGYGLWKDNFDAMATKTVIKMLLSKYAPLTTEMQTATLADQAVIRDNENYEYVDNPMPEKSDDIKEFKKSRKEETIIDGDETDKLNEEISKGLEEEQEAEKSVEDSEIKETTEETPKESIKMATVGQVTLISQWIKNGKITLKDKQPKELTFEEASKLIASAK